MATHISEININASPQKVFDVLTKPEFVKLWQFGRELITEWKVGSDIKFRTGSEENLLEQWGTVLEIRTNELIKYNLFTPGHGLEDKIENYCVTSYHLSYEDGQTKVKITQEDNRPNSFEPKSLKPILLSLKNIAENN